MPALEVAVGGTGRHRADGAHATIGFVGAAFIEFDFAGRFFSTGEQTADHHRVCTGGDGFGNVAGVADTAVGDDADFASGKGFGDVADGRDLRHANSRDDAGGADGARTNANFNHIRACICQSDGGFGGGDIAADDDEFRELAAQFAHAVKHTFGMTVGSIHHQHVHTCFGEQFDAFITVATGTNGCANAQAFVTVLAGEGVVPRTAQVFHGNKTFQAVFVVNK